ncbi:MAG: alpha/beta fold hydrolase [Leucobacter sp.]
MNFPTTPAQEYITTAAYTLVRPEAPAVVVALHGLGGDRSQPLDAVDELGADVAVVAPDLRAHGDTTSVVDPERLTFRGLADDVTALLTELGQAEKPVYITGISMGAAIALTILRDGALDVRGASLVRPAFSSESVPENLALMPMIAALLRTEGPDEGAAVLQATRAYQRLAARSPATAESLVSQFHKPQALERIARLTTIPAQLAYADGADFGSINVPVQVVAAPHDPVHPLRLAREWAELIPGASYVEVPARDVDPAGYAERIRVSVTSHVASCFTTE